MQVPRRKSEKYTSIPVDPNMTEDKFNELKIKLQSMLKTRPSLAKDVQTYAANGDFSENAEYQIAKARLRRLNRAIDETKNLINKAIIIRPGKNLGIAGLGSIVTIESSGKEATYQILGSEESKPERGIISHNSPIGKALLGKRVGEEMIVKIKNKEIKYKIIKIAFF